MAATTTAFNNLLKKLRKDHSSLTFEPGDDFRWTPSTKTVYYLAEVDDPATLLHEAAHGALGHVSYVGDVELLHLEREAWNKAIELGKAYDVIISEEEVEDALDTYRGWLHARSLCPSCQQNGVQKSENLYLCLVCNQQWKVNDARHCGLKRLKI